MTGWRQVRLDGEQPVLEGDAWVAPGAVLVGRVVLRPGASVWYGSVLRADQDLVEIGAGSNLQDLCVVHVDPGRPVRVGAGVSVGHGAVLHGCTVEDDVLVGMRATVMNGARIGRGSIVAAGAVVLEGTQVPPGSLVAGVPGQVRKQLGGDELAATTRNAAHYRDLVARHRAATAAGRANG